MADFSGLKRPHVQSFLSSAQYLGKRGVLMDQYDEPTYLGFWLEFEFNGGDVTEGSQNEMPEGLLATTDKHYSAQTYLNNIGYPDRAMNLQAFRLMLESVSKNAPWYITSVSGLDEVYKLDPKQNFRAKDKKITVKFLEGVDMRISSMFDLYRKAAFDPVYMRYMLPDIMRFFTVNVYVTEFRTFHQPTTNNSIEQEPYKKIGQNAFGTDTSSSPINQKAGQVKDFFNTVQDGSFQADAEKRFNNWLKGEGQSGGGSTTHFLKYMDEHLSVVKFKLSECEFVLETMKPSWAGELKADAPETAGYEIDIKIGKIREVASYPIIQLALQGLINGDDPNTNLFGDRNFDEEYLSRPTYDGEKPGGVSFNRKDEVRKAQGEASDPDFVYTSGPYRDGHLAPLSDVVKKSLGERLVEGLQESALAQGQNFVKNQINQKFLGNVYGISASTLVNRLSENPLALEGAIRDVIKKATNEETANRILGNIYDMLPAFSSSSSGNPGSTDLTLNGVPTQGVVEGNFSNTATTGQNPGNAGLTGANANPSNLGNIGLVGTPSSASSPGNAGLTGNNNTINGNPGNAGLTGAPATNSNPGNVGLTGANNNPTNLSNAGLTGNNNTINGNPGNAGLSGANTSSQGNPGNAGLTGTDSNTSGNPGSAGLTGANTSSQGNPGNVGLDGTNTSSQGNPGNVGLDGATVKSGNPGNAGLTGASIKDSTPGNVGLTGSSSKDSTPGNVGLTGATPNNASASNIGLTGATPKENSMGNVGLTGSEAKPQGPSNVGLTGSAPSNAAPGNIGLTGATPTESTLGNIGLKGNTTQDATLGNIGLTGSEGNTATPGNVGLTGNTINDAELGNIGLKGSITTNKELGNAGLTGAESDKAHLNNIGLKGNTPNETRPGNVGLTGSPQIKKDLGGNIGLTGSEPNSAEPGNIGLTGYTTPPSNLDNIGLTDNTSDLDTPRNIGLEGQSNNAYPSEGTNIQNSSSDAKPPSNANVDE